MKASARKIATKNNPKTNVRHDKRREALEEKKKRPLLLVFDINNRDFLANRTYYELVCISLTN